MRNRLQNQKSGSKAVTSDLIARLGFLNVQSQEPSSCEIDEFAVEQFFWNYQRTDLFCVMTADHFEHGFGALAEASRTEDLRPLSKILEQLFIWAFCNIIVNDGTERAHQFLDRNASYTTFPVEFVRALGSLDPNDIDNFPEISEYLMNPTFVEFYPDFYDHLNDFLAHNPIPGAIYLLKHFLHHEVPACQPIPHTTQRDNRPIDLRYRPECLTIPFHESNVPQITQRSQQFTDWKITRTTTGLPFKKPTQKPPHLPSLASLTVPRCAVAAAMDPRSAALAYAVGNDIFFVPPSLRSFPHNDNNNGHFNEGTSGEISGGLNDGTINNETNQNISNSNIDDNRDDNNNEDNSHINKGLNGFDAKSCCGAQVRLLPHANSVTALAFSSCGRFLLSADVRGGVYIQSVDGRRLFASFTGVSDTVTAVCFRHRLFAVGTLSGDVYVFETNRSSPIRLLRFHKNAITFIDIHPNCEYIASASIDETIRVMSITQAVCVRLWKAPAKVLMSARFSNDGKLLVASCSDGFLFVYDVGSAKVARSLPIDAPLIDARFAPNDQTIAIIDKTGGFSLWDTNDTSADSLIVLRIDMIKPITFAFLEGDEVRVVGNLMPNKYFEDSFR